MRGAALWARPVRGGVWAGLQSQVRKLLGQGVREDVSPDEEGVRRVRGTMLDHRKVPT